MFLILLWTINPCKNFWACNFFPILLWNEKLLSGDVWQTDLRKLAFKSASINKHRTTSLSCVLFFLFRFKWFDTTSITSNCNKLSFCGEHDISQNVLDVLNFFLGNVSSCPPKTTFFCETISIQFPIYDLKRILSILRFYSEFLQQVFCAII